MPKSVVDKSKCNHGPWCGIMDFVNLNSQRQSDYHYLSFSEDYLIHCERLYAGTGGLGDNCLMMKMPNTIG